LRDERDLSRQKYSRETETLDENSRLVCNTAYEEALDGGPLFVCRLNVSTGVWRHLESRGVSPEAQDAIALGSEYTWQKTCTARNVALLWRTNYDHDRGQGFSGIVMCLGRSTDPTARALLFQNYDTPIKPEHVSLDYEGKVTDEWNPTVKAGFLLPREIRESTINHTYEPHSQPYHSVPQGRHSGPDPRRNFSGPAQWPLHGSAL
jgi:hypothetical protein